MKDKIFGLSKFVNNRIYLLFHPLMLALYSFLIILFVTPDYFPKYTAKIIDTEYRSGFNKTFYYDLDGDGISEKVQTGYNKGDRDIYIQHFSLNNKVYDQWMPRGKWLIKYKVVFGDYNNNGFAEVYCLSIDGDSLFLSINELMLEGGLEIKDHFVCKAGTFGNKQQDVADFGGRLMDIDGDGLAEELKFVRDYLILQKKRLDDDLDFRIEADENIDINNMMIPHSLIFTFVENAIKHGLRPKPGDRKLQVIAKIDSGKTVVTITDNGIGRKQSHTLNEI